MRKKILIFLGILIFIIVCVLIYYMTKPQSQRYYDNINRHVAVSNIEEIL